MDHSADPDLTYPVREFTRHFRDLLAAVGERPGWYTVFARRAPENARAYAQGTDLPPWDVVRAVLHDAAAYRGVAVDPMAAAATERLHRAAVEAFDAVDGGESALNARLGAMLRERDDAIRREREAAHAAQFAGPDPVQAEQLANTLAWARDDRERATARCEELQQRLAVVRARSAGPAAEPDDWFRPRTAASRPRGGPASAGGAARPRGARFAGIPDEPEPTVAAIDAAPADGPAPVPRGARFAGAAADPPPRPAAEARPDRAQLEDAIREAAQVAALRRSGRSGEAHVLLCEAAAGPAERVPVLAAALEDAGLSADVATLLWEAAALPPRSLAAVAAALARAERPEDCRRLLNQAAARSAAEIAEAAAMLRDAGCDPEAETLLAALLKARSPEDAVATARERPELAGPLLRAAGRISATRHRETASALRRAGLRPPRS